MEYSKLTGCTADKISAFKEEADAYLMALMVII